MEDLVNHSPLVPFLRVNLSNSTFVTNDGYISLDDATSLSDVRGYFTGVVMSFAFSRTSSSGEKRGTQTSSISSEFNLTVYDDSALEVENSIAKSMNNGSSSDAYINITYGWSSNGVPIPGRYADIYGFITEYTLSFNGPSTVLEITGIPQDIYDGNKCVNNAVYDSCNPAEIVRQICGIMGWVEGTIIPTKDVYSTQDSTTPMTFTQDGMSYDSFIFNKLIPVSVSLDGDTGYVFVKNYDTNQGKYIVDYRPQTISARQMYDTEEYDEEGSQSEESSYSVLDIPEYLLTNVTGEIIRRYEYYSGRQNNEVISFSPDFKGTVMNKSIPDESFSTDPETNEFIAVSADGRTYIEGEEKGTDEVGMMMFGGGGRMMGISSSTFENLRVAARNLWDLYISQPWTATLEILGDPDLSVAKNIVISVYTKYGFPHHTSGLYRIDSIEDSIDGGMFTSVVQMSRIPNGTYSLDTASEFTPTELVNTRDYSFNETHKPPATQNYMTVAESQIGVDEVSREYLKYTQSVGLEGEGFSWSAPFVSWCAAQAGILTNFIPQTYSVSDFYLFAQANPDLYAPASSGYIPAYGDIFIEREGGASHVGFVYSSDGVTFVTIEGNRNDRVMKSIRQLNSKQLTGFIKLSTVLQDVLRT